MENSSEQWLPVPGYEDRYEVSDCGRVRSLNYRRGSLLLGPRIMKPIPAASGHLRIALYDGETVREHSFVHWLVLLAFVGPRPDGYWACHSDDDPANNRLENLKWATPKENHADAERNNPRPRGEQRWNAMLSEEQVREIRARYIPRRCSTYRLAATFGVSPETIRKIVTRQTWTHLQA